MGADVLLRKIKETRHSLNSLYREYVLELFQNLPTIKSFKMDTSGYEQYDDYTVCEVNDVKLPMNASCLEHLMMGTYAPEDEWKSFFMLAKVSPEDLVKLIYMLDNLPKDVSYDLANSSIWRTKLGRVVYPLGSKVDLNFFIKNYK